jgi:heavy metal sensor kinase
MRWTLLLWHAAILVLALTSLGTALYFAARHATFQAVDEDLSSTARQLAGPGAIPPPPRDWKGGPVFFPDRPDRHFDPRGPRDFPLFDEAHNPLANLPEDCLERVGWDPRDQPYLLVWSRTGGLIRASASCPPDVPAPPLQPPPDDDPPFPTGPGRVQFRQRGDFREAIVGGPFNTTLLVGRSVGREENYLRNIRWSIAGATAIITAIGLLGGLWLTERAIQPIRAISQTAKMISASELSRRIDVKETQSELGSLAQTLNQTFDRLETAFAHQVQFTADASHELRTPLSIIYSHTEWALTRERDAAEYRQAIEACARASARMKVLVESLLVLARGDTGKLNLQYENFDMSQAVRDCAALIAPLAEEKKVKIQTDLQPLFVEADHNRVLQLITNLMSNAIRYNREGGSVSVILQAQENSAVLKVTDTGVGIAAEHQPLVFERFFRADKARSRESGGSGLGLAICDSIVNAHGGQIRFVSQPGEGSTFIVHLPLKRGSAAE